MSNLCLLSRENRSPILLCCSLGTGHISIEHSFSANEVWVFQGKIFLRSVSFFPSALKPVLGVWPAPFPRPDSSHCSQMMAVCWPVQGKKKKERFWGLNSVSFTQLVLWRKETSRDLLSVGLPAPQVNQAGANL